MAKKKTIRSIPQARTPAREQEPQVRAKIEKNVPADLTKLDRAEILRHF